MIHADPKFFTPFINSASRIMSTVLNETPKKDSVGLEHVSSTSDEVNVMVGVTGHVRGNVIIGMSSDTAEKIASAMIGFAVDDFNALASSAISELCNLICGGALMVIAEMGHECDITPPTLIRGAAQVSTTTMVGISVSLLLSQGPVNLTIALTSDSSFELSA